MSTDVIGKFIFCPAELLSHCSYPTIHTLPYLNILPHSPTPPPPPFLKEKNPPKTPYRKKKKKNFLKIKWKKKTL